MKVLQSVFIDLSLAAEYFRIEAESVGRDVEIALQENIPNVCAVIH